MYIVIAFVVGACFWGYFFVGEFAYVLYLNVMFNVLDSYGKDDKVMMVVIIFMGFSVVVLFLVNYYVVCVVLDDLFVEAFGWEVCASG